MSLCVSVCLCLDISRTTSLQTIQVCLRVCHGMSSCVRVSVIVCQYVSLCVFGFYGVPTISKLLEIKGLFCRISSLVQGSFAKETYIFKEPTNRSHPILIRMTFHYTMIFSEDDSKIQTEFLFISVCACR